MGGPKAPEDKSDKVAQIEAQSAREARDAEAARKAEEKAAFERSLEASFGSGVSNAESYFRERGLDPADYGGLIRQKANEIRGTVPELDKNPASYFSSLGEMIYNAERGSERNRDLRALDSFAPAGFSNDRIADTADDDLIEAILGEQGRTAQDYAQNLFKRGVTTQSGLDAALKNIEGQKAGARSRLSSLTGGILNEGRSGAEKMLADARSTASNQELGAMFDPFKVNKDLESYFGNFFSGFGDKVRGVAPTDLFSTTGLANIAGAASGAQNTKFNPNALAGIYDDEDDDDRRPTATVSPF